MDGDRVTPLINGKECAYTIFENGIARCSIEKAWSDCKTTFRKPVSCHLYPIRVSKVGDLTALNYHSWTVCNPATILGNFAGVPLYIFLKDPILRVFGEDFFSELDKTGKQLSKK